MTSLPCESEDRTDREMIQKTHVYNHVSEHTLIRAQRQWRERCSPQSPAPPVTQSTLVPLAPWKDPEWRENKAIWSLARSNEELRRLSNEWT